MPAEGDDQRADSARAATQPQTPVLPKLSLRAIESASFVALVTAILYFMGYSYYAGFFERIALPPPYPELSTSDYFVRAFSSLSGLAVAALGFVSFSNRFFNPTTFRQAFWVNAPVIFLPLFLMQNARGNDFLDRELAILLGAIAAVGAVATLFKVSIVELLTSQWGFAGAIYLGLGIFLFFSVYFRLHGSADATKFIEGRLQPSSTIVLRVRDSESPVNDARLLVALARNGQFYLVQQASPAPASPIVYFVPESEVVTATMQRTSDAVGTPAP